MTLKAASSTVGTITDQEILHFQFKVYKKIKAPAEWTTHILFLESTVASTPGYTLGTLFNETQAKYTTLLNQGLWKPSDKTPEENPWPWLLNSNKPRKVPKTLQSPSPAPGRVPKLWKRTRKTPHLPIHQANWVTQNSGMERPTTGAQQITSTPTGIHTKWRSATPTRKCSRNKTSPRMKTKRKSLWMKTNSRRAWPPSSRPVTSTPMILLKLSLQP